MEISTLGCAALVRLENGRVDDLRLAFGVAAPTPIRCKETEAIAKGQIPDEKLYTALAEQVRRELRPVPAGAHQPDFGCKSQAS